MANLKKIIAFLLLISATSLLYQNCSDGVRFGDKVLDSEDDSSVEDDGDTDILPPPIANCLNQEHIEEVFALSFSANNQTCPWGQNGNLQPKQAHFQARVEQSTSFTLPKNSTLCDVDFDFTTQDMRYDDYFLMTFNNIVIASAYGFSNGTWATDNNSNPIYHWNSIKGIPLDFANGDTVSCLGDNQGLSNCSWPKHDVSGQINMDFEPLIIQNIIKSNIISNNHTFKFITLGDNDEFDCEHSRIDFQIRARYILN